MKKIEAKPSRMVVEMKNLKGKTLDKSVYLTVNSISYKPKLLSNIGGKKWKTRRRTRPECCYTVL
ncbi:MAG: hypothetical protein KAY65_07810 [Planctomycetes bacterium]|nr:hypothetical protein [Planctomycetota bacterium]